MAYTLAVAFDIIETGTGETISTQRDIERFDTRTAAEQAAARYKEAISRKRSGIAAETAGDIAFLSDEWEENTLAEIRIGNITKHRMIARDKKTGELFINYKQQRYYQSDFEAAAAAGRQAEEQPPQTPEKAEKENSN